MVIRFWVKGGYFEELWTVEVDAVEHGVVQQDVGQVDAPLDHVHRLVLQRLVQVLEHGVQHVNDGVGVVFLGFEGGEEGSLDDLVGVEAGEEGEREGGDVDEERAWVRMGYRL
jgi:hypothetical protein